MSTEQPRKALGKGLSALLPTNKPQAQPVALKPEHTGALQLPIDQIEPNPMQPRTTFQPDRLAELAQSIRENGVIQPLVVRRVGDKYQLVAGERRWRASRLADLKSVPVVVQDFADKQLMQVALIENIQREDLNPIEVAHAFEKLHKELSLSSRGYRPPNRKGSNHCYQHAASLAAPR